MSTKFQCHYRLQVSWTEKNGQPMLAEITDPTTIKFDINKVMFQSDNTARIIVTNMDGAIRESLYQDKLYFGLDEATPRKTLTLEAGYDNKVTMVCLGWISECYSVRNGVDVETIIEVVDPDILTEYCSVTFEAGTSFKEAYDYLTSQMPSIKIGEYGELIGDFKVPTIFEGNTFVAINKLTGQHTFIDNGVINTLNDNEVLSDYGCYLIQGETGLLETPQRREAILEVRMLFEPTLKLGQMVEIKGEKTDNPNTSDDSTIFKFNGQYKIQEIHHNCTISGSEEGSRTTTLYLQYINLTTCSNVALTDNPQGSVPSVVKQNNITPINSKYSSTARDVFNQIQKFAGKVMNNPITNLITWKDIIYPTGSKNQPLDVMKNITIDKLARCEYLAVLLTNCLNSSPFKGKKIKITSGYRTPQNNTKTENSANNSNHVRQGFAAIDFQIPGVPIYQLHNYFTNKKNWAYGVGTYSWGLHVSTNPNERFKGKG